MAVLYFDFSDADPYEGRKKEAVELPAPPANDDDPVVALPEPVVQSPARGSKADKAAQKQKRLDAQAVWLKDGIRGNDGVSFTGCITNVVMILLGDPDIRDCFTYDQFGKRVVCWALPWDGSTLQPREWTDVDDLQLARYVQLQEVPASTAIAAQAIELAAHEFPSHPPRDYLNGLEWDEVPRLGGVPHRYLGAPLKPFFGKAFTCWMISGVARIMEPGCKVDHVLTLEGIQGVQKSSIFKALLPADDWFSDDIGDRIGSRDAALSLQGKMIVELPEMAAFKGVSSEEFKAWVSRQVDRVRAPYGRRVQDYPRPNIFGATSNHSEHLDDQTGARRVWPIPCKKVDIEAIERDRDQLWAEAVHLYRQGEPWWFNAGYEKLAGEEQAKRISIDPWEEKIAKWLHDERNNSELITMARIMDGPLGIRTETQNAAKTKQIAAIMNRLGYKRAREASGLRRPHYVPKDEDGEA